MNEYEGCEPENCPDCSSTDTKVIDRQVIHERNILDQWCACNACGNSWFEVIQVEIEIRFREADNE